MTTSAKAAMPLAVGIVLGIAILVLICWKISEKIDEDLLIQIVYNILVYGVSATLIYFGTQMSEIDLALVFLVGGGILLMAAIGITVSLVKDWRA